MLGAQSVLLSCVKPRTDKGNAIIQVRKGLKTLNRTDFMKRKETTRVNPGYR